MARDATASRVVEAAWGFRVSCAVQFGILEQPSVTFSSAAAKS
jgi:hypothetical protein